MLLREIKVNFFNKDIWKKKIKKEEEKLHAQVSF